MDISSDNNGFVFAVDSQRNHIFQYSETDGRIISVTGSNGYQEGTFGNLIAVECFNDKVLALDSKKGSLTVFTHTDYGNTVRKAINLFDDGQYDASYGTWNEVLKNNGNMQLAYSGIGKALAGKGEHVEAMKYFKLANDREGYSSSFELERKAIIRKNFPWILPIVAILIITFLITGVIERKRKVDHETKKFSKWRYPFYIMMHDDCDDKQYTERLDHCFKSLYDYNNGAPLNRDGKYIEIAHTTDRTAWYKEFVDGIFTEGEQYRKDYYLGKYKITFDDNSVFEKEIFLGESISSDKYEWYGKNVDAQSLDSTPGAHKARLDVRIAEASYSTLPIMKDGRIFYKYSFPNPYPEKKLLSVEFIKPQDAAWQVEYELLSTK